MPADPRVVAKLIIVQYVVKLLKDLNVPIDERTMSLVQKIAATIAKQLGFRSSQLSAENIAQIAAEIQHSREAFSMAK